MQISTEPRVVPGGYDRVAGLLEAAARTLRGFGDARADSAAWRVADAGGLLRHVMEANSWTEASGLGEPTGLGCTLPKITRSS